LLIPIVARTSLATEWKTIISGLLAVGIPEVFTMAAIAIMGKSGFNLIIERIFSFLKKHGPPDRVSLTRYRIGLVMFVLPIVFGWLGPYTTYISVITYCVHFPGNCFFGKLYIRYAKSTIYRKIRLRLLVHNPHRPKFLFD